MYALIIATKQKLRFLTSNSTIMMIVSSFQIHMICLNGTWNLSTCAKVNSHTFDLGLAPIFGSNLEGINLTVNIDEILR